MVNDHGQNQRNRNKSRVTCRSSSRLAESTRGLHSEETHYLMKAARTACILAGFSFLGTILGFGQATPDPWLILASGEKGAINAHTTRVDLVRMYGAANVVDHDVDVDEEVQSATLLFPEDPERRVEILWKDPNTKTAPESADILGRKSRW